MERFSCILALFRVNLWGVILTHGSTGLNRLCSLIDALLVAYREMSAVVPAITRFQMVGISRGSLGIAWRTRIRMTSKYRASTIVVNSRIGLLRMSDTNAITSVEINRVRGIEVIYLLLILWAGVMS